MRIYDEESLEAFKTLFLNAVYAIDNGRICLPAHLARIAYLLRELVVEQEELDFAKPAVNKQFKKLVFDNSERMTRAFERFDFYIEHGKDLDSCEHRFKVLSLPASEVAEEPDVFEELFQESDISCGQQ